MREVIFNDGLVTIEVNAWGGVVQLHRTSNVPREARSLTLDEEEMDALCAWWMRRKAKKAKKNRGATD